MKWHLLARLILARNQEMSALPISYLKNFMMHTQLSITLSWNFVSNHFTTLIPCVSCYRYVQTSTRMYTIPDTTLCIGTHMGDHRKHGWPSVQKAWCFRVHRAQEQGKQHTRKQLQTLIAAIAVELHVTDYNPQRNWFYQVLKRHKLQDKLSGDKRVRKPSTDTEERPSLSGQAASNGPVQTKTTKNRVVAKAPKLLFATPTKSDAKAGSKGSFRNPQVYTTRPSTRNLDEGYDVGHPRRVITSLTEPISPAHFRTIDITPNQVAVVDALPASQSVVLDVNSPLIPSLTFPIPTAEELASFLYSTYIVPKITENYSFVLCREQLFHHTSHLIRFKLISERLAYPILKATP